MKTIKDYQTLPEKIISIDFGTSVDRTGFLQGDGDELNKAIDNLKLYDVAIIIYIPKTKYRKDYKINFQNVLFPETEPMIEKLKNLLSEGSCLTAYNGNRMDFLILKRRFGIDLSKYVLVDTCFVQRMFNSKSLRRALYVDKSDYSKIKLDVGQHMHLDDVYFYLTGKEMYKPSFTDIHFSTIDALINMDIFLRQFYSYNFSCAEEMNYMTNYFMDDNRRKNNFNYFFSNEGKEELYKRIDKNAYNNEQKIVFKVGQYKGKSIEDLSDNDLEYILMKYNIPYKKDGEIIKEHDPFPYEILYIARLEYKKRHENNKMA